MPGSIRWLSDITMDDVKLVVSKNSSTRCARNEFDISGGEHAKVGRC